MKGKIQRIALVGILVAFALGWVVLMNQGTAGVRTASGADGSTATITLINADSAIPTIRTHVLVRDGTGQPARGLSQEAFKLTEDGVPIKITGFVGAGEQVVTAILVIDHSGSMTGDKMNGAQEAAAVFVSLTRENMDGLGIVIFDDQIDTLVPLKRMDRPGKEAIIQQIRTIGPDGSTAFHDAVYTAIEQVREASGRKVVVALTDGLDNVSRHSVDQVVAFAKSNQVAVYTVGLGNRGELDTGRLTKLATATGGEFSQTPTADQLVELYRRIAQELQNEYVISYTSPTPRLDGTQREVVVKVEHSGGAPSSSRPYAVGGIIKSSLNYPVFASLLLLLLVLLALPSAIRRIRIGRAAAKAAASATASASPVVQPIPGGGKPEAPRPEPVAPAGMSVARAPQPAPPAPQARLVARFALPKESVSLGGGPGNDLIIPAPTVTAQHARIGLEAGRYAITDLSQGHTSVSFAGNPAQLRPSARNALKDGSLLKLGEAIVVFRQPVQGLPWLELVYDVTEGIASIGSETGNNIVLTHPSVSSRHAKLEQQAGRWVVQDLGSTQGTFVSYSGNPAQEYRVNTNALKDGSTVRFGQVAFVFKTAQEGPC